MQDSFWSRHSFITGLCTGFVTLGITIFGIDDVMERRASKRWHFVADVAYRGLARESRDISVTFAALYCDVGYGMETAYQNENFRRDHLTPLGEIRRTLSGKGQIASFQSPELPTLPGDVDVRLPEERIRFLLNDKDWVVLAQQEVSRLVDLNRETVAKWAALLMNSNESRAQLDRFSSINDGIFRLAYELQRFSVDERLDRIDEIWALFVINDSKARAFTNHLWHLAGEEYRFALHDKHRNLSLESIFSDSKILLSGY